MHPVVDARDRTPSCRISSPVLLLLLPMGRQVMELKLLRKPSMHASALVPAQVLPESNQVMFERAFDVPFEQTRSGACGGNAESALAVRRGGVRWRHENCQRGAREY